MKHTVYAATLGCKVNQYDTEAMLERFHAAGYATVFTPQEAGVCLVNTCTVTGTGDKKSLQIARRFKRLNPETELILTGCLAQRMGAELSDTGARVILGTQHRARVVELLEQAIAEETVITAVESLESAPYEPLRIDGHEGHTRAVMKIQEGCDNRCTYCVIPSVRGPIRSRPLEDIRLEAEALARRGFAEIVLTGVHLTSYGRDLNDGTHLEDALRLLSGIPGVARIRIGSLEPIIATEAFAQAMRELPKVCPQFHLALQSGSNAVLARMKRRYNTAQFLRAKERLLAARPEASFTTDVIVGFPGETEAEYRETVEFCKRIGFLKLHVFPYSPREGTPAAAMPGQISQAVKARRVAELMAVGEELSRAYRQRLIGTEAEVLVEERSPIGDGIGFTLEYVQVATPDAQPGALVRVRLTELWNEGMRGELVIS